MTNRAKTATFREVFALPPVKHSASTALSVPEMPPQTMTTGDREVDAVLWLQNVVRTGHQGHIDKALEAVKVIATPMKDLERRYMDYLRQSGAHPLQIAFGTMGFGELEKQAERSIIKARNRHEALARFGTLDALAADTPAEKACKKALRGLKRSDLDCYDDEKAAAHFNQHPALVPLSISDCLHARAYWSDLWRLRNAALDNGDSTPQSYAHECYCRHIMVHINPIYAGEAVSAINHLHECDLLDDDYGVAIMRNFVTSGWKARDETIDKVVRGLHQRCVELQSAPKGLSDMYTHAWDLVDGGLIMSESGVDRYEAAHKEARRALGIELMEVDEDGNLWPEHQERQS